MRPRRTISEPTSQQRSARTEIPSLSSLSVRLLPDAFPQRAGDLARAGDGQGDPLQRRISRVDGLTDPERRRRPIGFLLSIDGARAPVYSAATAVTSAFSRLRDSRTTAARQRPGPPGSSFLWRSACGLCAPRGGEVALFPCTAFSRADAGLRVLTARPFR